MLNAYNIYFIIFGMGAKPLDLYGSVIENDPYYQPVRVAHDVENHPIIAHDTGISIHLL
jgi:hypothetical protein